MGTIRWLAVKGTTGFGETEAVRLVRGLSSWDAHSLVGANDLDLKDVTQSGGEATH